MSTAQIDFQEIKQRVSLHQVMTMLNLNLKQSGHQYRGRCPIHGGDHRSFVVTPDKGFFCFVERKGGDQIELVCHVREVKHREAAEMIVKHYGLDVLPSPSTVPPAPEQRRDVRELTPLAYLEPAHEAVQAIISTETAQALGMGFAGKGTMRGRVCVPIRTRTGTLVAYCGISQSDEPQYLLPSNFDPRTVMWNEDKVAGGELYATRDLITALKAIESGIDNVICFFTESLTPDQLIALASLMDDRAIETVTLM